MLRNVLFLSILSASTFSLPCAGQDPHAIDDQLEVAASDWPWWRGPHRTGVANADQDPPIRWDESTNVLWKVKVDGKGHGSPIVFGDRIYLNTANQVEGTQSVVCFDRRSGKQVWSTPVHRDGLPKKINGKATHASTTPACDGKALYVGFVSHGAAYVSSLTLDGKQRWQTRITDYVVHQGYAASPFLYQDLVLVGADNKKAGATAALHRETGDTVWTHTRPKKPNYPSPIVLHLAGKDQLFLTGCDLVTSLVPNTGKINWEIEGATTECVTSTVTDGEHIFTSGGYPDNHMSAVKADGSGKVAWRNRNRVYVPSLVAHDGYLYGVLDAGVAMCWEAATGKEMWKSRFGGTFSSSPVLVNDRIYVTNEEGKTFVFRANSKKHERLATNQLGDIVFATPAICASQIYMRVAKLDDGVRQEWLYCLAKQQ